MIMRAQDNKQKDCYRAFKKLVRNSKYSNTMIIFRIFKCWPNFLVSFQKGHVYRIYLIHPNISKQGFSSLPNDQTLLKYLSSNMVEETSENNCNDCLYQKSLFGKIFSQYELFLFVW